MLNQFVIVSVTGQWQEAVQTEAITRTITHPPGLSLISHGVDLLLEPEWRNIHFCSKVNSLLSSPDSLLRFSDFSRVLLIWKMAGQGQSGWWQRVSEWTGHFSVSCTKVEIGLPLIHRDQWEETEARQTPWFKP